LGPVGEWEANLEFDLRLDVAGDFAVRSGFAVGYGRGRGDVDGRVRDVGEVSFGELGAVDDRGNGREVGGVDDGGGGENQQGTRGR